MWLRMFYVNSSHFNAIVPSKMLESRRMRQNPWSILHAPPENCGLMYVSQDTALDSNAYTVTATYHG